MFYEGDLQSALAEAVQMAKLVACLVRDDDSESVVWENEFLTDPDLRVLLMGKTILIRLNAGSQEAGFLAAIYPLPKTPTFVIIQSNGQLREYLTAGISKADFKKRVLVALGSERNTPTSQAARDILTLASSGESNEDIASTSLPHTTDIEERSFRPRELSPNETAHKEEKINEQVAAEKAESSAADSAVTRSDSGVPKGDKPLDPRKLADTTHAQMQKKFRQDARDERARILKRIEDDRAERRARDASGKEHAPTAEENSGKQSSSAKIDDGIRVSGSNNPCECAIQVRLFDGTTIRSKFPAHNTTREHIRQWVDSQRPDGDTPYIFKQILAPSPNRTISISEEEESLESLGLTPSATLVLVPIKEYTSAYTSGATDYISKGIYTGWGLVSSGMKVVAGALSGLVGSTANLGTHANDGDSTAAAVSGATNVRIMRDQLDYSEEYQLYNGNALNFEPRRDEDQED